MKQQLAILKRILGYMLKSYKLAFALVVICIVGTALATLRGTLFMQSLIDDYIIPLTKTQVPDYSALAAAIGSVAITYGIGILCAYIYQRLMVNISQGTMRNIRLEIFAHMEALPIRYFDTRAHGDIMSVYTNDADTLRQVISQSIPQMINSIVTLIATFAAMFLLAVPLTLVTLVMVCLMFFAASKIAGHAARYFTRQQKDLGAMNGYIEEMINGQKVTKVFCHEEAGIDRFTKFNEQLRESTDKPILGALVLQAAYCRLTSLSRSLQTNLRLILDGTGRRLYCRLTLFSRSLQTNLRIILDGTRGTVMLLAPGAHSQFGSGKNSQFKPER